MEKLERYLDQVCRSLGGPRAMRQHVRQELREHLLDAVAQHKAAGAPEDEAIDRALDEFGKPDDVRTELEAAHGYRMMAVAIDKAMQWKEMTMKAKWLWTTWAYLALGLVIVLEVWFITFTVMYILPKFQKLMSDGLVDPAILDDPGVSWIPRMLLGVGRMLGHFSAWGVIVPAALWGAFEWRVRSENKALMRLSALGTIAVGLMIVVILTLGSLVVSFCLGIPATARIVRPFALAQVQQIELSMGAIEAAAANKNWKAMPDETDKIAQALGNMTNASPVIPALLKRNEPPSADELRASIKAAQVDVGHAQEAIRDQDFGKLEAALRSFRKSYESVRDAARRPVP